MTNMFQVVGFVLLVLSAGIHSSVIQNAQTKNEGINDAAANTVNLKVPEPNSAQESIPTALNINSLAEKVLRIHGVRTDTVSEENNRNIEYLKKLIANIQRDLDVKLQEMATKSKVEGRK